MSDNCLQNIHRLAKKNPRRIVLPESLDERILRAAQIVSEQQLAYPVLFGDPEQINKKSKEINADLSKVEIIDAVNLSTREHLQNTLEKIYQEKNKPLDTAQVQVYMNMPLYLCALMVRDKQVDGCLAGAQYTTANVLKAAFSILGSSGKKYISSAMIMAWSDKAMIFSDCAVNIDPTAEQLVDIAIASAENAEALLELTPRVAMLSFSTHGSAAHDTSKKVAEATAKIKEKNPQLIIDGEIQLDAAIHPPTAKLKIPASPIKGDANVLIFPNLSAGNIGYKLVERLANAKAIGPILQGINYPMNDLSRGASIDDIVNMCAITSLQASQVNS